MAIGIREIISGLHNDNVVYGDVSKRNNLGGTKMDSWTAKVIVTKAGNTITYGDTSERRDLGGKTMALDKSIFITTGGRTAKDNPYYRAFAEYCERDIKTTEDWVKKNCMLKAPLGMNLPNIKNVIFNPPATVVYFEDGTKTVVKCQEGDEFDAEKGLAMAIAKRAYGNKGNYCDQMKKWVEEYEAKQVECMYPSTGNEALAAAFKRFQEADKGSFDTAMGNRIKELKEKEAAKPWRIWYRQIDPKTLKAIGSGVDLQTYNTFDEAMKAAYAKYMYNDEYHFWISKNSPWTGSDE